MDIKECPFCESIDTVLDDNSDVEILKRQRLYWVQCSNCLAEGPKNLNSSVAISKWNFPTERIALFKQMAEE